MKFINVFVISHFNIHYAYLHDVMNNSSCIFLNTLKKSENNKIPFTVWPLEIKWIAQFNKDLFFAISKERKGTPLVVCS